MSLFEIQHMIFFFNRTSSVLSAGTKNSSDSIYFEGDPRDPAMNLALLLLDKS